MDILNYRFPTGLWSRFELRDSFCWIWLSLNGVVVNKKTKMFCQKLLVVVQYKDFKPTSVTSARLFCILGFRLNQSIQFNAISLRSVSSNCYWWKSEFDSMNIRLVSSRLTMFVWSFYSGRHAIWILTRSHIPIPRMGGLVWLWFVGSLTSVTATDTSRQCQPEKLIPSS